MYGSKIDFIFSILRQFYLTFSMYSQESESSQPIDWLTSAQRCKIFDCLTGNPVFCGWRNFDCVTGEFFLGVIFDCLTGCLPGWLAG